MATHTVNATFCVLRRDGFREVQSREPPPGPAAPAYVTARLHGHRGRDPYNHRPQQAGGRRSLPVTFHYVVFSNTVQYSTVQYSTVQYSTVQYSTVM